MGFFHTFWNYLQTASPYLFFGFFIAGVIKAFLPDELVKKWMGGANLFSIVKASLIGIPLPMCSCAVVPTAVSLRKSGAGVPATSSFLISTPQSGVDSIALTYALMDIPMTIIRPLAAFLTAFVAGLMQFRYNKDVPLPKADIPVSHCACSHDKRILTSFFKLRAGLRYAFFDLIEDLSLWMLIGLLVGGLIEFLVPADLFVGMNPILGKFVILAIGVPLYICDTASTPIAASLIMKGLSPGSAILLLLIGPATNVANIVVLQKYIGKKGVIINISAICIVGLVISFIVDAIYSYFAIPVNFRISAAHAGDGHNVLGSLAALLLLILLIRGVWIREIKPRFK